VVRGFALASRGDEAQNPVNWLSLSAKDLRFAARLLIRSPGLSVIAVMALAIGIGLTTAMFSVVNGTILRGLPFDEPDEILNVLSYKPEDGATQLVSVHDYADWRERQSSFEGLAVWIKAPAFLRTPDGKVERYDAGFVSSNLFDLLRVEPYLGRDLERDDELPGSEQVVILAHGLWQNRFDADPSIVGRRLILDGITRTVVGVMPPGFAFPIRESLWIPVNTVQLESKRDGFGRYFVFGRLADGVTEREAQAELSSIARRLALEYPETNRDLDVMVGPYINEVIGEKIVNLAYMMLAAVFGVLLVACANVAILQLTRATLRTKEVAARLALGATRRRVMIQSLLEAAVLSTAGALGGLAIAQQRIEKFNEALQSAPMVPFWLDVRLDGASLMLVLGLAIFSSLMSGSVPALRASRTDLAEVLKSESGGSIGPRLRGFSRGLVIVELALSCGILVGAGLMIKTVLELDRMNFAFATREVLTLRVTLERTEYPDPESQIGFCSEIVTRLREKPGVEAVALTSHLPGMGSGSASFVIEGKTEAEGGHGIETRFAAVSPEFFDAFAVRLVEGRPFGASDDWSAPRVAIVNQSFVDRYTPDENPLGKRVRLFAALPPGPTESWTIVGVAPDLAMNRRRPGTGLVDEDSAGLYVPMAQRPSGWIGIAIRTKRPPMSLPDIVRAEIETIAPGQAVYDFNSLDRAIADQNVYYWLISDGFSLLGLAALFLASIGLYGIMSSSVNRRRQEIGVRVAMGAQPGNVLGMILKQGMTQLALGILLGLCLAIAFAGMLEVTLFQVEPWDPFVFSSIVLALLVAGTAACIIPARRATRVDPVAVLRQE
jgi:putative ABC transport system permease protein